MRLLLRLIWRPTPFLFQFFEDEIYAPASLLVDLCEYLEHFLLFAPIGQALGRMSE